MKRIYTMLLCAAAALLSLAGCRNKDPYFTATEDDYPIILNTTFDKTGQGNTFPGIYRNENFTFELVVTPAEYTTVSWYIDSEMVFQGKNISIGLLAGVHDVKVVATTTKGKETFRTGTIEVLPLENDPVLNADGKNRWLQTGTRASVNGSNLAGICKAFLKVTGTAVAESTLVELENFSNEGSRLCFNVPELASEGDFHMILENEAGEKFGAGKFNVRFDGYVDPGIISGTIWEGSADINWGDSNVRITPEMLADVPQGATVILHYEMIEADYHALRVTNNDWSEDIVPQVDEINVNFPDSYEFTYSAEIKAIAEGSCMLVTGFGYRLTSVTYETKASGETTVWEGAVDINWGDSKVELSEEITSVPAGSTIILYYEMIEADYHALRVTNNDWSEDIVPQVDEINVSFPDSYEILYTAEKKAIADGSSMVITGFGYKLTKVAFK